MGIIDRIRDKYRWRFVGIAEGRTVWKDYGNLPDYTYWHLYERGDGKRRFVRTGNKDMSSAARFMEAKVMAWKNGGPRPEVVHGAEPPKPKAKLVAFPGGKGGAA